VIVRAIHRKVKLIAALCAVIKGIIYSMMRLTTPRFYGCCRPLANVKKQSPYTEIILKIKIVNL
jgi:hypothetical protein